MPDSSSRGAVTRGEQMLALRRRRMASSPPFLRGGFRPFFFGAAAWAAVAIAIWLWVLRGGDIPSVFDAVTWHRHEMLFGFVGAAISGFLLTAIPNWTGRLPIAGPPLAALFGLWAAARILVYFSGSTGLAPAFAADVGFYLILAAVGAREVIAAKNRNIPVVGLVILFGGADAADYAANAGVIGDATLPTHFAVSLVTVMISLIGGRIIPSFTRNWLAKAGSVGPLPSQPGPFDKAVIAATALALLCWLFLPEPRISAFLLVVAGVAQAVRLFRWRGYRTFPDPLLFILHVGYGWIPVGLMLLSASAAMLPVPVSSAVHALTAGAMGTMILAVMSRASLGHTGRELKASGPAILFYGLVTAGALVRVIAPFLSFDYSTLLDVAGALWGGAMLVFVLAYAPVLFRPRLGEAA